MAEPTSPTPAAQNGARSDAAAGSPLLQISNALVRLYKEAFGRGPTKARAQFAGPDTLVVLLEDSMTVAERNLAGMGEHERLRQSRQFLQYALEGEFRKVVEDNLGRRTLAFISGFDPQRDVSIEVFTLQPLQSADPEGGAGQRQLSPGGPVPTTLGPLWNDQVQPIGTNPILP